MELIFIRRWCDVVWHLLAVRAGKTLLTPIIQPEHKP